MGQIDGERRAGEVGEGADLELVRRMRLGDETALEGLYARYGGLVYTLALRIVGDPELAREVYGCSSPLRFCSAGPTPRLNPGT